MNKAMIEAKKELNMVICGLIVRNMEAGASYEKAKSQAFNRMEKDSPEMLNLWFGLVKQGEK